MRPPNKHQEKELIPNVYILSSLKKCYCMTELQTKEITKLQNSPNWNSLSSIGEEIIKSFYFCLNPPSCHKPRQIIN